MVEVLQFYTSSFGVWLGITIGLAIVASCIADIISAVFKR